MTALPQNSPGTANVNLPLLAGCRWLASLPHGDAVCGLHLLGLQHAHASCYDCCLLQGRRMPILPVPNTLPPLSPCSFTNRTPSCCRTALLTNQLASRRATLSSAGGDTGPR